MNLLTHKLHSNDITFPQNNTQFRYRQIEFENFFELGPMLSLESLIVAGLYTIF